MAAEDEQIEEGARFRLRWTRVDERREAEFRGTLHGHLVSTVEQTREQGLGERLEWFWRLHLIHHGPAGTGEAKTARAAAHAVEALFWSLLPTAAGFNMRREAEIAFRERMSLPPSPTIVRALAIEAGEHLPPADADDIVGMERWLKVERAAGRQNWIRPSDMKAWFGSTDG